MNNKEDINDLFSNMLGVNVNLIGEEAGINEQQFYNIIGKWEKAWMMQNAMLLNFGLIFEGYDSLLYDALDNLSVMMFGKEKVDIIHWYVYESKRENGVPYKLINPKNAKEYTLATPKDLYFFLKTVETFEFEIDNSDEDEEDED